MNLEEFTLPTHRQIQSPFDALDISVSTKQDYEARLPKFKAFLQENGLHMDSYLYYKQYLEQENLGVSAKNKYLVSAKAYLKELHRYGFIPVDITVNVKSFTQKKKHKRSGLTREEVHRLCDWLYYQADPLNPKIIRLRAIISLLLFQGLRAVEITRLNREDIDFGNGVLFVRGKGESDKEMVHLHPQTIDALWFYVETHKYESPESKHSDETAGTPLFVSISNSSQGHRLTTRGLRTIVHSALGELGIDKTIHGFRHFYTTVLIHEYGGNLLQVARYTRHSSLEMLQVYNDDIEDRAQLQKFYNAFEGVSII